MGRVIKNEETVTDTQAFGYRRVRRLDPAEQTAGPIQGATWQDAKAIAQVGCELAAAGRLEDARVIFEGLTDNDPRDSALQSALGTVYQKLGRMDDAMAAYDSAIEFDPRNPVALGNRGELLLKQGSRDGFTDLIRAVEADPHGETAAARRAKALVQAITAQAVQYMKRDQEK